MKNGNSILTLPCCNQEGFLRKSSRGLKHFVHLKSRNTCDWQPESPEHLMAKIEIVEACKENGWVAIPEYSDSNWIADVLAIKDEKKIAFEVQWSRQSFEVTKFRQDRYKESKVRGCWFFRTAPKELRNFDQTLIANKEIPAFQIHKDEDSNIITQINQSNYPLKSLVSQLLNGRVKFCEHICLKPKQEITIVFFETSCWKCNQTQHCFTVEKNQLTLCNQDFHVVSSLWDNDDFDKNPQIYEAVKTFLKSESGKELKVGELKKRYSRTVQDSYVSHGCYYCDAIFGDFFLCSEKSEMIDDPKNIRYKTEINFGILKNDGKHWCVSEDGKFCE